MKLKERLASRWHLKLENIDYEIFKMIIENIFSAKLSEDMLDTCTLKIQYVDIDFQPEKLLFFAFHNGKRAFSKIDDIEFYNIKNIFITKITWDIIKKWCYRFCSEKGFTFFIVEKSKSITIAIKN